MILWVQHISGMGEKWRLKTDGVNAYHCTRGEVGNVIYDLPKSEYVLFTPSEPRWEECTREYVSIVNGGLGYKQSMIDTRWVWSRNNPETLAIERKVTE